MRGRRERGVKRFKTSSFMWFLRQDGTETAQRIVLPQNAGKPEEHGSGERVPWQNRGELFSTRRFDGGQLNGQYKAAGNADDGTGNRTEEREDTAEQRMMQMSEQPLQHEQRQHTSCNCAPAIAAWPTTALLPRKLSVRRLGPRLLHSSSIKKALFCNSGTIEAGCTHVGARGSGEDGSAGTHPPLGFHDELSAWIRIRRRSAPRRILA